jgi:predicted AAA+ superfamily ATPase
MMDKPRFLEDKINRLLAMFPVVAIVGARQCGKSTLVKKLRPEWHYYDLERPDDYRLISSDPLGFFGRRPAATIIDEAQQYPELFPVLRGIIDQDRKTTGRYLLTGSSSPEIVKGLTESLAGRIAMVELSPFKVTRWKPSVTRRHRFTLAVGGLAGTQQLPSRPRGYLAMQSVAKVLCA